MTDEGGDPTGETLFLYQPKAYVVIGNLGEFGTSRGINEAKFSSFEIFRRSIMNPEIITFDELYERARYIVDTERITRLPSQIDQTHHRLRSRGTKTAFRFDVKPDHNICPIPA